MHRKDKAYQAVQKNEIYAMKNGTAKKSCYFVRKGLKKGLVLRSTGSWHTVESDGLLYASWKCDRCAHELYLLLLGLFEGRVIAEDFNFGLGHF